MGKDQVSVFMIYAIADFERFNIIAIDEELGAKPRIHNVLSSAGYDRKTWEKHMGEEIEECDVFLLFCSQASLHSKRIAEEWQMAYLLNKIVIPIFIASEDIPTVFKVVPSYKFDDSRDINVIIEEIYEFILIQAGFSIYESNFPSSEDPLDYVLRDMQRSNSGIEAVALVSREGIIVNYALPDDVSPMHIAAMSAIILSTSERVLLEFKKGELDVCIIQGSEGKFICMECGEDFILVCVCDDDSTILTDLTRTSKNIQRLINSEDFDEHPDNYEHITFDDARNYTQESGFLLNPYPEKPSNNENTVHLIRKSINAYKTKKFKAAIKSADKIIESDPKEAYAWYMKSCAYISLAKYPRCVFCSNRAIELEPNNAEYFSAKGYALYKMKRYEEAIKCYNKAIELDSKNPSFWSYKGLVYRKMRTVKIAYECYDKALKLDPDFTSAWNNKGIAYDIDANYEKALECYDNALNIDSNYAIAWHNKTETLIKQYKWDKAIYCIEKALELKPTSPYSWFLKTDYFYKLGRNEEARECLLNAMKYITPELLYRIETSDFTLPTIT